MDSDSKAIAVDEPGEHAGQAAGKMYTNNPMYKEKDVEGVISQGDIKSGSAGTRYTMKKSPSLVGQLAEETLHQQQAGHCSISGIRV